MAVFRPFKALRPTPEFASRVAALPYDVMNSAEAKEMVVGNPYSFLHVDKAEIDLPEGTDLYSAEVYAKAKENLEKLENDGICAMDETPCFYVYRQIMNGREQTGLVGCAWVDDYIENRIKKHELTRADKEADRIRHVDTCDANTGPIFLCYRDNEKVNAIINEQKKNAPVYDFLTDDAIEKILLAEKKLPINIPPLAGFYFRRKNSKTNYVYNSEFNDLPNFATSLELAFLYHQIYDKAEVFYTDILRKFPFPKIKNNKFIPEALVWYRIANEGYKLCVNTDVIYLGNYIEDGYTKNFSSNLKKNPKGFMMYYKECLFYKIIPLKNKIKYFIRYIQCLIFSIGR